MRTEDTGEEFAGRMDAADRATRIEDAADYENAAPEHDWDPQSPACWCGDRHAGDIWED